jgi:SagB-type dehydrogenase family enzyme
VLALISDIMLSGIGDQFQNETKHQRGKLGDRHLDWGKKPETYKKYPVANTVKLPKTFPDQSLSVTEALKRRKSTRFFSSQPLLLNELAFLCWAATGVQRQEKGYDFRTSPSAGALYPIETYVLVNNVEGLSQGLYHYDILGHALEELKLGDYGGVLARAALGQVVLAEAPAVFVWTAIFERSKWKYKQRAYRYVYLDAGHIAGNLALSAASIGLGSCQVGAFFDDEANGIIGVDGTEESVIYLSVVGK